MKITERTRYPHPVLSEDTGDFPEGVFAVSFGIEEDPVMDQLSLTCTTALDEPALKQLLAGEEAKIGIDVRCADTYYSDIRPIEPGETKIVFEPGLLSGRVSLKPIIWTTQSIGGFFSSGFHEEYSGASFNLDTGTLIAWDTEQVINVGRKKLAPMDSIFALAKNSDLEDAEVEISLEDEKIQIFTSENTFRHIHLMRQSARNQAVVLNGVYLPAVMQVIAYLRNGEDYSGRAWYQTFRAKCDFYGIDLTSMDLLKNAQTLLQRPYRKIEENFRERD